VSEKDQRMCAMCERIATHLYISYSGQYTIIEEGFPDKEWDTARCERHKLKRPRGAA
jgi:hypothetical protein